MMAAPSLQQLTQSRLSDFKHMMTPLIIGAAALREFRYQCCTAHWSALILAESDRHCIAETTQLDSQVACL